MGKFANKMPAAHHACGGISMDSNDSTPAATPKPLSPRARRFIAEFLKDCNGAQAAIRAGYSPAGAAVRAAELLRNLTVSTAIHDAQNEILKETQVTVARIVRELALIAFFDPASILDDSGHPLPISELPPEIRRGLAAIQIVESANGARRLNLGGKLLAALIALGKHMAMFTNRIGDDPTDLPPFDPEAVLAEDPEGEPPQAEESEESSDD
jgi:phage terminase small subunit